MEWWKARPTWQKVSMVIGAVFVVAVIASPPADESPQTATTTTAAPIAADTTGAEPTTTTTAIAPTTTASEAATTTTISLTLEEMRLVLAVVFEEQRLEVIDIFDDVFPIERVDQLEYAGGDLIEMAVTTSFASLQEDPEERSNDAWVVMQLWGEYFSSFLASTTVTPEIIPGVELTMNVKWEIVCHGDFIVRVAERRASQSDMNEECTGLK